MDINVSAHGLRLDPDTDGFVRSQVRAALQRFEDQVVAADVRKAKRAVRRSVKKSLQKHRWRAHTGLREATES